MTDRRSCRCTNQCSATSGTRTGFRKFSENPYVDHVPILVAIEDGVPVGFRPFFAQEMRIGGVVRPRSSPAIRWFTRIIGARPVRSHERTGHRALLHRRGTVVFLQFPNENSKPGNLAHGWREIGTVPAYYRPQNPISALGDRINAGPRRDVTDAQPTDDGPATAVTDTLEDAIATSQRASDRLLVESDSELEVEYYETPPAETLAAIYRRSIPEAIHTNRTAAFYRWRFDNPVHSYAAYVARRDGDPIAALVVSSGDEYTRIIDTRPSNGRIGTCDAQPPARLGARRLCGPKLRRAFGETLPAPLRFRFYPDTRFPLSALIQPTSRTPRAESRRRDRPRVEFDRVVDVLPALIWTRPERARRAAG